MGKSGRVLIVLILDIVFLVLAIIGFIFLCIVIAFLLSDDDASGKEEWEVTKLRNACITVIVSFGTALLVWIALIVLLNKGRIQRSVTKLTVWIAIECVYLLLSLPAVILSMVMESFVLWLDILLLVYLLFKCISIYIVKVYVNEIKAGIQQNYEPVQVKYTV